MKSTTAIRSRVLTSMNLSKVIACEKYATPVVRNNSVCKSYKIVYRAYVLDNDEYKFINGVGRTESDALKKLNDSLFEEYKIKHPSDYNKIVKAIQGEVEEEAIELLPEETSSKEVA